MSSDLEDAMINNVTENETSLDVKICGKQQERTKNSTREIESSNYTNYSQWVPHLHINYTIYGQESILKLATKRKLSKLQ